MNDRISREELVRIYNVEITFFDALAENGLLHTETEGNIQYLLYEELPAFERYTNMHYDLDVNIPGLEVISHLVRKMELLQREKGELMRKLQLLGSI